MLSKVLNKKPAKCGFFIKACRKSGYIKLSALNTDVIFLVL